MSRIEGKVAQILSDRELVLNIGASAGVQVGMRFKVLYRSGIDVVNPDNPNDILGYVEWPKTEVKIVSVKPRLSVGRTFRTITIPAKGTGMAKIFASLDDPMGIGKYEPARKEIETLRSNSGFAAMELSEAESVVQIGDLAVQDTSTEARKDLLGGASY